MFLVGIKNWLKIRYLWKGSSYLYKKYCCALSLKYLLISLIYFNQLYCLEGYPGSLLRSKMGKNIFACLFRVHNTISLSRQEKVCLIRLRFRRYFSRWWEKYLSKSSLIKHTCSWLLLVYWKKSRISRRKVFLKNLQNSPENTRGWVYF